MAITQFKAWCLPGFPSLNFNTVYLNPYNIILSIRRKFAVELIVKQENVSQVSITLGLASSFVISQGWMENISITQSVEFE